MSEVDNNSGPTVCVFCGSDEDSELRYGKVYHRDGVTVHYFCLLFSANLHQSGEDEEGILGFLIKDIKNEVRRGMKLFCSYCRKRGATVGCCVQKCKKSFHLPCGLRRGSQHIFEDDFRSYCVHHRQQEPVHQRLRDSAERIACSICYDNIDLGNIYDVLWAPCCKEDAFFHRDCVQRFAMTAGYFFKCPLCNNKKEFQAAMTRNGVFVPSQDAAWELEPNAFQELLYKHNRCDAPVCACREGRYHSSEGKWKLVLCQTCASQGVHAACGGRRLVSSPWHCTDCSSVLSRRAREASGGADGVQDPATAFERRIYESWRKQRRDLCQLPPGPLSFKEKMRKKLMANHAAARKRILRSSLRQLRASSEDGNSQLAVGAIGSGEAPSHSGAVSASPPVTLDGNQQLCTENQFRTCNVQLSASSFGVRRPISSNPPMAVINPVVRTAAKELPYLHTSLVNNLTCEGKDTEMMDISGISCQPVPSSSGTLKESDAGLVGQENKFIGDDDNTEARLSKTIQHNCNINVDFDSTCREMSDSSTNQAGFVDLMKRTFSYCPPNFSIRWPKLW